MLNWSLRVGRADLARCMVADEVDAEAFGHVAVARRADVHPRGQRAAELARGVEREVAGRLQRQRAGQLGRDIARDDREAGRGQVQLVEVEQEAVGEVGVGDAAGVGQRRAGDAGQAISGGIGDDLLDRPA